MLTMFLVITCSFAGFAALQDILWITYNDGMNINTFVGQVRVNPTLVSSMSEICPYHIIHMSVWFILIGLTGQLSCTPLFASTYTICPTQCLLIH